LTGNLADEVPMRPQPVEDPSTGSGRTTRAILVVDELDVATAASVDPEEVAGIVVAARGRTGHGAIVAGSRGIPLFLGAGAAAASINGGQLVAFDARSGRLWTSVSEEQVHGWSAYVAEREAEHAATVAAASAPALTRDGVAVPVLANLGSLPDAELAALHGADGSGLVRTEVLFADRSTAPTVAEQTERLRLLAEHLADRPLTVRTWDVGGDKTLPFLPLPREANPFLGVRGVRAFLGPGAPLPTRLLADQLAAIARRAPVSVLLPMITTRQEVDAALTLLAEAVGSRRPADLRIGIMIETPAAALSVGTLAAGLDFVSLGTNDLTAYVAAADRASDAVAELADPLSPAVLRLVDLAVRERPEGVAVAVCGDLASRTEAVPLLLGLGVQELSCAPPMVPAIKAAVRRTDLTAARALAAEALRAADADGVRALLDS
jgi:phosphocarrier protein FPr